MPNKFDPAVWWFNAIAFVAASLVDLGTLKVSNATAF